MFRQSEPLESGTVDQQWADAAIVHDDRRVMEIHRTSRARLAELVHHLGDVPVDEARRAIRQSTRDEHDPLTIVASALLHLRRETLRYSPV